MSKLSSIFKLFSRPEAENSAPSNLTSQERQEQAEAAKNRGNEFLMSGNHLSAIQSYEEALRLVPAYAEALVNLGSTFRQIGRPQEARQKLQEAVAIKSSLWQGHFQLGLTLSQMGLFQDAVDSYQKSIDLNPDFPESHWRKGSSLVKLGKSAEAIHAFRAAPLPEQDFQEFHADFGFVLMQMKQFEEARHQFQIALNLGPTSDLHLLIGRMDEALSAKHDAELSYRNALTLNPENENAHFQLALMALTQGDYLNGFTHFEYRLKLGGELGKSDPIRQVIDKLGTDRYWKGEQIPGNTILIIAEQGLGDSLMMQRYLPLLKSLKGAAKVYVYCFPAHERILRGIPEIDQVFVRPAVISNFDCYCTMMSLPHAFRTELNTIPAAPEFPVTAAERSKWAARVSALKGFKVGIVWSGNPKLETDAVRSVGLERMRPLFSIPGIEWVSLQKGKGAEQLKLGSQPVHDWMDDANDLMDTAALMACLDLVITVDTSVVHLAGTMGRPTWLLNRYETDWRWLLEREDSPWYPTVRIFRQSSPNDWDSVIEKVDAALRLKVQSPPL